MITTLFFQRYRYLLGFSTRKKGGFYFVNSTTDCWTPGAPPSLHTVLLFSREWGESDVSPDSRELTLAGIQAVADLANWPQAFVETATASLADIGLSESSGRGFNNLKPTFLSHQTSIVNLPSPHWLRRSSDARLERKTRERFDQGRKPSVPLPNRSTASHLRPRPDEDTSGPQMTGGEYEIDWLCKYDRYERRRRPPGENQRLNPGQPSDPRTKREDHFVRQTRKLFA
jgi:hypothetical protein